jgi:multicomponent Na+:H+ antiporter subunit B
MPSIILSTATRFLITLLMLLPAFLLLRGHNLPGGGFVAALVAATAVALYAIAFDVASARRALRVDPRIIIAFGLLLAASSGVLSLLGGQPFLTGLWTDLALPGFAPFALGTPLLFDVGVFFTVFGVAMTMVFAVMEED